MRSSFLCRGRPPERSVRRAFAAGHHPAGRRTATRPLPHRGRVEIHALSVTDTLNTKGVDIQRGLTAAEAAERLAQVGPNTFTQAAGETRGRAFLRQYADPMQLVLLIAGLGSLYPLKEYGTGVVLIALTLLNAALGLHQEGKAAAAVSALQKMMIIKAKVRRDGTLVEVPADGLVPGD